MDDNGILFCCDVQISPKIGDKYKGCNCKITYYYENTDKRNKYEFYSEYIDSVWCHWSGIVKRGENEKDKVVEIALKRGGDNEVVENYLVPNESNANIGDSIEIRQIKPYCSKKITGPYAGKIEDFVLSGDESSKYKKSPIREFIKVKDGAKFLKYLHEKIEEQNKGKERIFIIRAASLAGKIEKPMGHYKEYDKEFCGKFGERKNWHKYMHPMNYKDDCDEIKKFIKLFDNYN